MAMIMPSAHEVSPVLQELNHGGPRLAIGLEAIFKPGSPGASNGKRVLRAIGATRACRFNPRVDRLSRVRTCFQIPIDAFGPSDGLRPEQRLAETRLEERSVPRWQHQRVARGRDFQDNEHRT